MIEEIAIVTRYADGRAWIKAKPGGACGGCRQQSHCGTASLVKGMPRREFELDCRLSVQPGDQVRVHIDDSGLLLASLLAYMLPMAVMLAMVIGFEAAWPQLADYLPIVALAGVFAGGWLSRVCQNKYSCRRRFEPRIVDPG